MARECAEDLAADGVVYAEVRFAPERHAEAGLTLSAAVEAVVDGLRDADGRGIVVRVLLTAMRDAALSTGIARLAVRYRDVGVVGFDIAGAEVGNPPTRHLDTFHLIRRENGHSTIHAGEAFGLASIWQALQWCNADRLGHGARLLDDITPDETGAVRPGGLASFVRDTRVPPEISPTSNVNTGVVPSLAAHPIGLLTRLRFRVAVNTDNRLISDVTLSGEPHRLAEVFGYGWRQLRRYTLNAMKSAFLPFDERPSMTSSSPGTRRWSQQTRERHRDLSSRRDRRADRVTTSPAPEVGVRVTVVDHPLAAARLTTLRDATSSPTVFRAALSALAGMLVYEAARELPAVSRPVTTPVGPATGVTVRDPVLVPVLRAGLGMLDAALALLPGSRAGFVGVARDELTLRPRPYLDALPSSLAGAPVLVLDPMVATGGSLVHCCELLAAREPGPVTVVCVLVAPEGLTRLRDAGIAAHLVTAGIDERLDERGFIVPGLGDAGDRQFGDGLPATGDPGARR